MTPSLGKSFPRITWNRAPNQKDYLLAEVSLPKMMFGSNVRMVETDSEIRQALTAISRLVSDVGRVDFEGRTANVSRVHFCYNFQMTPKGVSEYIQALRSASFPRTERTVFQNETVQFSNGTRTVTLYDKLQQTLQGLSTDEATNEDVGLASGVLRLESRYNTSPACRRLAKRFKFDNWRAETLLRTEVAEMIMNEAIGDLGLDEEMEGADARLGRLLTMFEPEEALALAGFMVVCDTFGAETW